MLYESTATGTTLTLTRAELSALVAIASKDVARETINAIQLNPGARTAAATDGHRLLVATAGPAPFRDLDGKPGETSAQWTERNKVAKAEHAAEQASNAHAKGRGILIKRDDAAAWVKAAGAKDSIRIEWGGGKDAPPTARILPGGLPIGGGAAFGFRAGSGMFPAWNQVIPTAPTALCSCAAVNAAYLADACAAFAKLADSKLLPTIRIWTGQEDTIRTRSGGRGQPPLEERDPHPFFVTLDTYDGDAPVSWRYLIMPVRDVPGASPWRVDPSAAPKAEPADASEEADAA